MFAPRPPDLHWWYNMEATLDNGTMAELSANGAFYDQEYNIPHTWDKPDPFYVTLKNHRWFKYFENGINISPNNQELRMQFARWLCRYVGLSVCSPFFLSLSFTFPSFFALFVFADDCREQRIQRKVDWWRALVEVFHSLDERASRHSEARRHTVP